MSLWHLRLIRWASDAADALHVTDKKQTENSDDDGGGGGDGDSSGVEIEKMETARERFDGSRLPTLDVFRAKSAARMKQALACMGDDDGKALALPQ